MMNQIIKIVRLSESLKLEKKPPHFAVPIVRFAKRVEIDSKTKCWNWLASLNNAGYGNFNRSSAHRFIYEYIFGAIPIGMQIDHLCRNRKCCNPEHLEMVTAVENFIRGRRHCARCCQNKCTNH
jgi:hypothetical protein